MKQNQMGALTPGCAPEEEGQIPFGMRSGFGPQEAHPVGIEPSPGGSQGPLDFTRKWGHAACHLALLGREMSSGCSLRVPISSPLAAMAMRGSGAGTGVLWCELGCLGVTQNPVRPGEVSSASCLNNIHPSFLSCIWNP